MENIVLVVASIVLLILFGSFVAGTIEDFRSNSVASPVSNGLVAILPAAYAWQLYGWIVAAIVYLTIATSLAGVGWAAISNVISWRTRAVLRALLVLSAYVVLGLSAAQICDSQTMNCHSAWSRPVR